MAERFAASIGRRPVWTTVDFGALIVSLAAGKIDTIITGMAITPERQERIDFSEPYHAYEMHVFVRASDIAGATPAPAATPTPSFWEGLKESFQNNIIREDRYLLLWSGLKTTVLLAVLSCLFGSVLGALVCVGVGSPLAVTLSTETNCTLFGRTSVSVKLESVCPGATDTVTV